MSRKKLLREVREHLLRQPDVYLVEPRRMEADLVACVSGRFVTIRVEDTTRLSPMQGGRMLDDWDKEATLVRRADGLPAVVYSMRDLDGVLAAARKRSTPDLKPAT